jgi:hypothetical protein
MKEAQNYYIKGNKPKCNGNRYNVRPADISEIRRWNIRINELTMNSKNKNIRDL